jgi:hypothetical protein
LEERDDYLRQVLDAYRTTPGTTAIVRRSDRLLAERLYERAVPLVVVQNALLLAAARRLLRPEGATPLPSARSLAYFLPVIDEVMRLDVGPEYYELLRTSLQHRLAKR